MTAYEAEALERWQAATYGKTERRLRDLSDAADDLTTLSQSREGIHVVRANYQELCQVLRKLHDLAIECKGVAK